MKTNVLMRSLLLLPAVIAGALPVSNAFAAAFFAGRLEKGNYIPQTTNAAPCYEVRYCTLKADLKGNSAQTTVELTVIGEREKAVALALIPLPDGIDRKALLNDFPGGKILDADEAQTLCRQIATATRQAAVMSLAAKQVLLIPELPVGPKANVVLRWSSPVRAEGGVSAYTCPIPNTTLTRKPVSRLTLGINVADAKPVRGVFSPTHALQTKRPDPHHAECSSVQEEWFGGGNFRLLFAADDDPVGLRLLTYRDADVAEDGYFLLFGCPSGIPGEKSAPKDIVFVLDTSGSMRGEKLDQSEAAIMYCLKKLNPGDRFNIITFGTEVRQFRADLVAISPAVLKEAATFMEETVATGRTNIGEALKRGQAGRPDAGRLRMMVFLTDGTPTAGEQAPEKILDQFVKENESRTKVFVVGVGNDVNAHLLDRLAESSEGSSEYVGPDEDIDVKVAALYDRLANPFLNEVQLDFGELKTAAVFPKKLTALFQGSDIMLAGRYKNGGKHKITLAGTLNGEKRTYRYELDIPAKPGAASATDFVAPLWASRNIGFYLQEIRLHGQTDELVKEVIRLSKQFGIVTEYTAFLAQGGGHGISDEKAFAMARDSMKMANAEQSGKWAMAQVENERKLQAADAAAPAAARSFKDSRGEVQSVAKVRTLGRRALYQQASGQWLDSEAAGDRTNRTVKAFSPEYFDLMQRSDDFRQAAELGDNLSINIGQERITVEK